MNSPARFQKFAGLKKTVCLFAVMAAFGVSGCAIDTPTTVHAGKPQLVTENYSSTYQVAELGGAQFDEMANRYSRHGSGELEVIIGYDPHSRKNTAMKATDQLHRVLDELSRRGVKNVKGSILALENSGDQPEMIIGYKSINAEAPEGCDMIPGYYTMQAETDYDYKLGCSVNTIMARQVAHPEDLGGRAVNPDADGRRTGAMAEPYRAGQPNSGLSGAYSSTN
ncbi:MAG: hypothetical protein HYS17_04180 [Micavibrio aeruginosavorus]|uniref:Pilus assembly protein CpaD n=1 Tax=Micavibrio aeruginosavorus TaxID=349221 RepID=A0A7T5R3T3_9BACT|nr:MAG: hypothetical protein HYS17_04180 [Micavibrio aeruginosavorus]